MIHHLLAAAVLILLYLLLVLVKPTRACPCRGRCPRCKGTGRKFLPGARPLRAAAVTGCLYLRARRADRARADS